MVMRKVSRRAIDADVHIGTESRPACSTLKLRVCVCVCARGSRRAAALESRLIGLEGFEALVRTDRVAVGIE